MKISLQIFFLMICFFNLPSFSQTKNTDNTNYPRLTKLPIFENYYTYYHSTEIKENDTYQKLDITEWRASLFIPTPLKNKKTTLLNKIDYNNLNYTSNSFSRTLHSIKHRFIIIQNLSNQWKIALGVSSTLASDFNNSLNNESFYYGINTIALKRINTNLKIGFGLTYTTLLENGILIPVINLTYKKNKWVTNLYMPQFIKQTYHINKKSNISLTAKFLVSPYQINPNEKTDANLLNSLTYSRFSLEPQYQLQIFKDLYFNISSGLILGGLITAQEKHTNIERVYNIKNHPYLQVGLRILK